MTELEDIYELYFKDVYLFILSLSKDRYIAEDITSETFLKALNSLDTYQGKSDIKVWLFQIAKNTYFSYLRKHKRVVTTENVDSVSDETNLEKDILIKEDITKVHQILHDLPEPYKEVFTLRLFANLSYKEISRLFNKTDNWACVTYYRAKKKLIEGMRELS